MAFNDDLSAAVTEIEAAHQQLADATAAATAASDAATTAATAQLAAQTRRDTAVAALKAVADQA